MHSLNEAEADVSRLLGNVIVRGLHADLIYYGTMWSFSAVEQHCRVRQTRCNFAEDEDVEGKKKLIYDMWMYLWSTSNIHSGGAN